MLWESSVVIKKSGPRTGANSQHIAFPMCAEHEDRLWFLDALGEVTQCLHQFDVAWIVKEGERTAAMGYE